MTTPMRRCGGVLGALLATAALASGASAAQLYKCVDGGRTVYQQQACPLSAEPQAVATAARPAAKASAATETASVAATKKLRPASSPASAVPATPR